MIQKRFLYMDRRDFLHGCRKCWTTPLTQDCLPRQRKDTTGPLSTLCTKTNVLDTPNLISPIQLSGGLFMTNNLDAFLHGHQSSHHYPRVLVSIVVSGTLSSRTLRCDELLQFVPYPLARRLSLSWVFLNFTVSCVYPYPFLISCHLRSYWTLLIIRLSRFS